MWDKPFGFYFFLFIIMSLFFKFYAIIYGFLPAIATSCVLAYLTNPLYIRLVKVVKLRSIAAFIVIFFIFTLILVPAIFLAGVVQDQFQAVFTPELIDQAKESFNTLDEFIYKYLHRHVFIDYLEDIIPRVLESTQNFVTSFAPKMLFSITKIIINAFVTLFILYYLLLNSKQVIDTIRYYGPLSDDNMTVLLGQIGKETRTLFLGQLLIALIQGSLAAAGFFIFGISGFILWGVFSAVAALIPVMGAGLIWFPASVFLILRNEYFNGIGLFLWGALIVSSIDNIIRPKLTNILGKIHPVTVLLGVFIGIKEWGIIGIVLGPLIISTLIILIKMFREQYLDEE